MNARRCLGGLAMMVLIVPSPEAWAQRHGGTHAHHSHGNVQSVAGPVIVPWAGAGCGRWFRLRLRLPVLRDGRTEWRVHLCAARFFHGPGRVAGHARVWSHSGRDRPGPGGATASAGIRRRGCRRSSGEQDEAERSGAGSSAHDLGRPALSRGQSQEGRGALSASGQARPDSAAPQVRLAQIALVRGQYTEAANRLREAETAEPGWIVTAPDIQSIYGEPAEFARQLARLESHVQIHPDDRDAWLVLGAQWFLSGRTGPRRRRLPAAQ